MKFWKLILNMLDNKQDDDVSDNNDKSEEDNSNQDNFNNGSELPQMMQSLGSSSQPGEKEGKQSTDDKQSGQNNQFLDGVQGSQGEESDEGQSSQDGSSSDNDSQSNFNDSSQGTNEMDNFPIQIDERDDMESTDTEQSGQSNQSLDDIRDNQGEQISSDDERLDDKQLNQNGQSLGNDKAGQGMNETDDLSSQTSESDAVESTDTKQSGQSNQSLDDIRDNQGEQISSDDEISDDKQLNQDGQSLGDNKAGQGMNETDDLSSQISESDAVESTDTEQLGQSNQSLDSVQGNQGEQSSSGNEVSDDEQSLGNDNQFNSNQANDNNDAQPIDEGLLSQDNKSLDDKQDTQEDESSSGELSNEGQPIRNDSQLGTDEVSQGMNETDDLSSQTSESDAVESTDDRQFGQSNQSLDNIQGSPVEQSSSGNKVSDDEQSPGDDFQLDTDEKNQGTTKIDNFPSQIDESNAVELTDTEQSGQGNQSLDDIRDNQGEQISSDDEISDDKQSNQDRQSLGDDKAGQGMNETDDFSNQPGENATEQLSQDGSSSGDDDKIVDDQSLNNEDTSQIEPKIVDNDYLLKELSDDNTEYREDRTKGSKILLSASLDTKGDYRPLVKNVIIKFLNQRFLNRDTFLNTRATNFEQVYGSQHWKTKDLAIHYKTKQFTKIQFDKYKFDHSKGKIESIPLSFYFDLSGSMSRFVNVLATIAIELLKNDVKVLIGENENVYVQLNKINKSMKAEDMEKIMTNLSKDNKNIDITEVNEKIDSYLITHKAEKCVVFADFDPRENIINLANNCQVYWFNFENNYDEYYIANFNGYIHDTQNVKDIMIGLNEIRTNNFQYLVRVRKKKLESRGINSD